MTTMTQHSTQSAATQAPPSIDDVRRMVSRMLDGLDPRQPISAIVLFQVDPAREDVFVSNLRALAGGTRRLPGLKIFSFHKRQPFAMADGAAPQYLIYEEWKTVQQFRRQWDSEHLKSFQYGLGGLVVAAPDLRFFWGSDHVPGVAGQAPVLATGQKRCWDADGTPVDCAGSGQDGAYQAGVAFPDRRYTDHGDGTVTDHRTGLVWMRDANAFGQLPWLEAVAQPRQLADGVHGLSDGSRPGDWRLPNINELQSLLDLDSDRGPALPDHHPFLHLEASNYWSSTSVAPAPALGWYTALAVGPPVFDLKINQMRVWPVRGSGDGKVPVTGQTLCYDEWGREIAAEGTGQDGELRMGVPFPQPRYLDHDDGTVTDQLTGLTWLRDASAFASMDWGRALATCNALHDGEAGLSDGSRPGDWRLPNVHELRSLIDYSQPPPAVSPGHPFSGVQPNLYWSSTTVASAPTQARFVFVGMSSSVWDHKSMLYKVWPVKGGRSGGSGGGGGRLDRRAVALALAAS